jgi:broad specificity phosphatase PhoE
MKWLEKYSNDSPSIATTDAFKTFDFGELAGSKQTKDKNSFIHNNIINSPEQPMIDNGESFNDAVNRVIPTFDNILSTAPANTAIITHNSVFGLINLWNKLGKPEEFSKEHRIAYTKQDGNHKTGDSFTVDGANGPIYVIRHGETTDNTKGNFRSDDTQLTDKGVDQAKKVGENIPELSQIISSPLPRVIATANIIASQQDDKKKEEEENWLEKYKEGGFVQPNYNNSSVSFPEGFVGWGINSHRENYNSAWGGQFQNGGVIKDSMGQWNHPGEITEIPSNRITMKGVGYPVLGVSDKGDVQLMHPEQEYKYKGNKVTEFPLLRTGGNLRKNIITFTNNESAPKGWLSKYETP